MRLLKLMTSLCLLASLAGCYTTNKDVGIVTGAVIGSQFGGNSTERAVATIAGAVIGGAIGDAMDAEDQRRVRQALESTPTDDPYKWTNPDSNITYRVVPTRTYYDSGRPCREYVTTSWINGEQHVSRGLACRTPSGSWRAVR